MSTKELKLRLSEETALASRGYKLLKKLGEGSYAQVFLTEFTLGQEDKRRQLACKVVDTSKAPKDFVKNFFPRELDILIRINHPHIIHIHSIFQRKLKYFIFMRHAENGDLLEFILKKGPISESQTRVWMRQLALAVEYLHEMEIAHRDLKCENCLITSNFNLKLADFGFSRFVIDNQGKKVTSSTYCGSLSYAAPEILRGMPYYPKIADLWSVGIILYIMVNKAMPFDDTNVKRLYEQQINKKWKIRSKVIESLSQQIKTALTKLLEPDITKRWKANQILTSEWMAMDPKLMLTTPAEEQAFSQAHIEKKAYIESLNTKRPEFGEKKGDGEIKVWKHSVTLPSDEKNDKFISGEQNGTETIEKVSLSVSI